MPNRRDTADLIATAVTHWQHTARERAASKLKQTRLTTDEFNILGFMQRRPEPMARDRAAQLLGIVAHAPTVDKLLRFSITDPSGAVRESTIASIINHLDTTERGDLELVAAAALHDRSDLVREAACLKLSTLESEDNDFLVLPIIYESAASSRPTLRARAIGVLGYLRPFADESLQCVESALDDSDSRVRLAALRTVARMPKEAKSLLPKVVKRSFDADFEREACATLRAMTRKDWSKIGALVRDALSMRNAETMLLSLVDGFHIHGPEAAKPVCEVCERRTQWLTETAGHSFIARARKHSLREQVRSLLSAAELHDAKRRQREAAWLIGEIFRQLMQDQRNSGETASR